MRPRNVSVLVVDDDERMLRLMTEILGMKGYHTLVAGDGESALKTIQERSPDLILLDVMMPRMDGYTLCRRIREFSKTPIIMVTAKGDEMAKTEGLGAGADDYVTKPFSARELAARARAVLRRSQFLHEPPSLAFHCDDLTVDFVRRTVTLGEREAELTATEYKLLSYLAHNAGLVLSDDQMLENVWGKQYIGEVCLLWVNVGRLRKKLGDDPKSPRFILTRPGAGYMMPKKA